LFPASYSYEGSSVYSAGYDSLIEANVIVMRSTRTIHSLLYTALLLLVLVGLGHVHNHICLDGQEPQSVVHFENLGGHPDHPDDATHADVENELTPQLLSGKPPSEDAPVLLLSFSLLFLILQPRDRNWSVTQETEPYHPPPVSLPPSRAPPSLA
jgi:hypothetical protein